MKMLKCPACKGTGQQTLTVFNYPCKKGKKMKITCVVCKGSKGITALQKMAIERERAMWCRCEKPGDPVYHDDTATMKHHWSCSICRKFLQVG